MKKTHKNKFEGILSLLDNLSGRLISFVPGLNHSKFICLVKGMFQCVLNILMFIYEGQSIMERLEKLCTVMYTWLNCCQAGAAENNPKATPESVSFLCHPWELRVPGDTVWPGGCSWAVYAVHTPALPQGPPAWAESSEPPLGDLFIASFCFFPCPVSGFNWLVLLHVEKPVACYSDFNCVIQHCDIALGGTSGAHRVVMVQSWALAVH